LRLLLLSDIHSNLEALEACLAAAPPHDAVANLGDIVGYGASPNEVTSRVRELGGTADDKQAVPTHGWFAACKDTEGTSFSLWQGDESAA